MECDFSYLSPTTAMSTHYGAPIPAKRSNDCDEGIVRCCTYNAGVAVGRAPGTASILNAPHVHAAVAGRRRDALRLLARRHRQNLAALHNRHECSGCLIVSSGLL